MLTLNLGVAAGHEATAVRLCGPRSDPRRRPRGAGACYACCGRVLRVLRHGSVFG